MSPRRRFVDAAVRGLLAPGIAGRYRLLTVWAICTAGMALLLTAVGYAAIGQITQTASGQFARLHDEARHSPAFVVERVGARILQPLLQLQAARVEAELLQVQSPADLEKLFADNPEAVRLSTITRHQSDSEFEIIQTGTGWQMTERWSPPPAALAGPGGPEWYAATGGPRWCAAYAVNGFPSPVIAFTDGTRVAEVTVAAATARWLRIETLPAARCFIVRDDGVVLALGTAAHPGANVPGPLQGGVPLPRAAATEDLNELTKRINAGEAGTRVVTDSAGVMWVVAFAPLHELGGSYGLLVRRNELAPELDAYSGRVTASVNAADDLVRYRARRYCALLLYLLAAVWFIAVVGGWVILRMLDLRRR